MKQFRTFTEGMQDETRARLIHNQLLRVLRTFNKHWRNLYMAGTSVHMNGSWNMLQIAEDEERRMTTALDYTFAKLTGHAP